MCGDHQYTIRDVLETRRTEFGSAVIILSYRDFLSFEQLPVSDYVFSDLERLTADEIAAAAERLSHLTRIAPTVRVLNRPDAGLRRLPVSHRLHAAGINRFRVLRAVDIPDNLKFPVFVRRLDDHNGPVTGLLDSYQDLHAALEAIEGDAESKADLGIVEFVDTRNSDGLHEKMSYFRVGNTFFPGALNASDKWVVKGVAGNHESEGRRAQRIAFLTGNPHEEMMREVFDVARLEYGRADYAMIDGRPQVFEINTNPTVVPPEALPPEKREYSRIVLGNWFAALKAYSCPSSGSVPAWVAVPKSSAAAVPASSGGVPRRFIHRALTLTNQLHRETAVMRPLRALWQA